MSKNKYTNGYSMTIAKARKAMGMIERNYSDDDILEILRLCHEAAEYGYEEYIAQL